ncbi:hypothetical protein Angca_008535, partial [Angiostrongylus cantonensis]
QAKYYYDLYNCRYFAPFLLLFLYSILGAWVFHLVEYENEKEMKVREVLDLDRLRTNAFQRIVGLFQARKRSERLAKSKDLLLWYENELQKVKLPEALEWDMWGALFYVGTIFTTIGYGNIVPRTITGRALSVVYAIIGIPLVLAILSRFGQFLEHNIARVWLKHREKIKEAHKQTRKRISTRVNAEVSLYALEEGKLVGSPVRSESFEDRLIDESRQTIPIWLALLICISWICACAGLFLIWEKRWTFFTSLYFFFISLSTIGLGDVVPDHPHMLILMFWLVIIGLSIVSMLLAVIQIKFEECLYNFMIRMQEEYQRNLANGLPLNHEEIRKRAMEDQPFLMKLFGPDLISDSQMEKIEEKAEQFERITRSLNNKNIQTEIAAAAIAETQVEKTANSIACDPMTKSDSSVVDGEQIPWSKDVSAGINEEHLTGRCADEERDSMSDATSLPLDSIRNTAVVGLSKQAKCVHVQTDIAQFQIDEIVLRLAALQANRDLLDDEDVQPALFCAGRRGRKKTRLDSIGEKSVRDMSDKEILTTMLQMMTRSMETDPIPQKIIRDQGVNTETHPLVSRGMNTYPTLCRTQSIETDVNDVVNRSVATDATILVNRSMETSRQESVELTNMPWDEKVYRDMMTSPILQRLLFKTTGTAQQSVSSGDIQVVDEFQQTSLSIDRPRPMADQTVQTSMSIDRPLRSVVDQLVQTSISITLPSGADQSLQTSVNTDTPPQRSVSDQSLQTSMNTDRLQRSVADQSVQTSISTDAPPRSVADQSVQTSISTDITLSNKRARSSSTSGIGNSIYDDETRQEVIIQTDDSYLKLARRLDEYRSNRTQFLPVVAASPLGSRDIEPFKGDRPSERCGYYLDIKGVPRRRSIKLHQRGSQKTNNADSQTGASLELEPIASNNNEKSRSISPMSPPRPRRRLARVVSLPAGVARGKVGEYIAKHERGIPNPAIGRDRPVRIVRQYAMVDKET